MTRPELLTQAVVEAARRVMAAQLMVERAGKTVRRYTAETERDYVMQDLRDALAAHRRGT